MGHMTTKNRLGMSFGKMSVQMVVISRSIAVPSAQMRNGGDMVCCICVHRLVPALLLGLCCLAPAHSPCITLIVFCCPIFINSIFCYHVIFAPFGLSMIDFMPLLSLDFLCVLVRSFSLSDFAPSSLFSSCRKKGLAKVVQPKSDTN